MSFSHGNLRGHLQPESASEMMRDAILINERYLAAADDSNTILGIAQWKEIQYRCAAEALDLNISGALGICPTAYKSMNIVDVTITKRPTSKHDGSVEISIEVGPGRPVEVVVVPHSTAAGFCVGVWLERREHLLGLLLDDQCEGGGGGSGSECGDSFDEQEAAELARGMFSL